MDEKMTIQIQQDTCVRIQNVMQVWLQYRIHIKDSYNIYNRFTRFNSKVTQDLEKVYEKNNKSVTQCYRDFETNLIMGLVIQQRY